MHKRIHRNENGQETELELIQENIVLEKDENDDVTEEKPVEKEKKLPRLRATLCTLTNTEQEDWLTPHLTKESPVILVLSDGKHIELRQVIRETWGNGHDNVYFVIGQYCPVNHRHWRHELTCDDICHTLKINMLNDIKSE
jgi:DNA-directed RNA polymerase subunit H (RpoH/RPB5)